MINNPTKLKRALEMYQELWLQSYPSDDTIVEHTFSPEFEKNMARLIARQKKPYYSLVNTVGKRVAIVVLAIFLALAGTVFSVPALREPLLDFITEVYETFTNVVYNDPEEGGLSIIETYYAPSYIPEGFVLETTSSTSTFNRYMYRNKVGDSIEYCQMILNQDTIMVDTEATFTETIISDGLNGLYYENKDDNNLVWDDGINVYKLAVPIYMDRDELIAIAISLDVEG